MAAEKHNTKGIWLQCKRHSLVFVVGPSCVSTFLCGLEGLPMRLSSKSTNIVKEHSSIFPPGHKEGV